MEESDKCDWAKAIDILWTRLEHIHSHKIMAAQDYRYSMLGEAESCT